MSLTLPTTKVDLSRLQGALSSTIKTIEEAGYVHAVQSNVLVLQGETDGRELNGWINSFSLVHPSRFFVVSASPDHPENSVEVSGRCHLVSSAATVCSEVIQMKVRPESLPAVPSLIRAHALPSAPTHLFILDESPSRELLLMMTALAGTVYFDSDRLKGFFEVVGRLKRLVPKLVDLQWISLAGWRSQVKAVFDRGHLVERIGTIGRIELVGSEKEGRDLPAPLYLMAGWVLDRLGLDPISYGASGYECRSRAGRSVELSVETVPGGETRLDRLTLFGEDALSVMITRAGGALETSVEGPCSYRWSQLLDDESSHALLERFFLVGESTTNYPAAAHVVQLLHQLKKAF